MTAASVAVVGVPRSDGLTPGDTSEATIFAAGDKGAIWVLLHVANLTGTTANATVVWDDGANDHAILDEYSIDAHDYVQVDLIVNLRSGNSIKVTSGTGSALSFTVTTIERTGANAGR